MPIVVLFFQENGLTISDILILRALFSVAIIMIEVPSGYFADVMGRKICIIIGTILGFAGFVVYSLSTGFWEFLGAQLILGLAISFLSGSDRALIYDSLIEVDRTDEYKKIEGRMQSVGQVSEGVAGLMGGVLATISLRTPFYVQAGMMFFAIPVALSLVEPPRKKPGKDRSKSMLSIVKYALHENRQVKWLIYYGAVLFATTVTLAWLVQPFLKSINLGLIYFGVIWAGLHFSGGGFSLLADWWERSLGKKWALVSLIFLVLGAK